MGDRGSLSGGTARLGAVRVEMVADVAPFEEMKLRLLNGAHSAIAYLGLLFGKTTVSEAFAEPLIRRFVLGLWAEAIPSLRWAPASTTRATRPASSAASTIRPLKHRTAQIANDGSQKLPQRILSVAASGSRPAGSAQHLMLVPAAWLAAAKGARRGRPAAGTFHRSARRAIGGDLRADARTRAPRWMPPLRQRALPPASQCGSASSILPPPIWIVSGSMAPRPQ